MRDSLVRNSKIYFSLRSASKSSGYTKDYLGQLCRNGNVDAFRENKSWYVSLESIVFHQRESLIERRRGNSKFANILSAIVEVNEDNKAIDLEKDAIADVPKDILSEKISEQFVPQILEQISDKTQFFSLNSFIPRVKIALLCIAVFCLLFISAGHSAGVFSQTNFSSFADRVKDVMVTTLNDPRYSFDLFAEVLPVSDKIKDPVSKLAIKIHSSINIIADNIFSLFKKRESSYAVTTPPPVPPPLATTTPPVREKIVVEKSTTISPVIEHVIERSIVLNGITKEELDRRLNILENEMRKLVYSLSDPATPGTTIASNFNAIALTNKIDHLQGITLDDVTITNSSFSGGSMSGLANLTLTSGLTAGTITTTNSSATSTFAGGVQARGFLADVFIESPFFSAASSTATSTFRGGFDAKLINVTSSSATSTFANGIRLAGGCFQLADGNCAGTGSGSGSGSGTVNSGTVGRLAFYAQTGTEVSSAPFLFWNAGRNQLGVATTTPYASLSVWASTSTRRVFDAVSSASTTGSVQYFV